MIDAQEPFDPARYWEGRLRERFDLTGVGYVSLGPRINAWMYRLRKSVFLRTVRELGVSWHNQPVLDVGSGTGFYVDLWQSLGARVTGVDITEVSVSELRARFPACAFFQADVGLPEWPLPDGKFAAASAMDVLFHIVDEKRYQTALGNIVASLRPGGYFLYSDNFVHGKAYQTQHQISRSLTDISRELVSAGFEIVSRRPMFYFLNVPVDTPSDWPQRYWHKLMFRLRRSEVGQQVGGAILYALDSLLVRVLRESPTTELMVCRKRA